MNTSFIHNESLFFLSSNREYLQCEKLILSSHEAAYTYFVDNICLLIVYTLYNSTSSPLPLSFFHSLSSRKATARHKEPYNNNSIVMNATTYLIINSCGIEMAQMLVYAIRCNPQQITIYEP